MESTEIGMDGFTEILELQKEAEVVAHFSTNEDVMNKRPAATLKKNRKRNNCQTSFLAWE